MAFWLCSPLAAPEGGPSCSHAQAAAPLPLPPMGGPGPALLPLPLLPPPCTPVTATAVAWAWLTPTGSRAGVATRQAQCTGWGSSATAYSSVVTYLPFLYFCTDPSWDLSL